MAGWSHHMRLAFIHFPFDLLAGEKGGGRECPRAQRRWAGGHVCARAQPASAWADEGGRCAVEAAAADPQEPWLRRQLSHQTRHPEGGTGEAEDRAPAGGGKAGPRECQHEAGAGRAAGQVRGPAVFRQNCYPGAIVTGEGGHHQRHHHRQVHQPQQRQSNPILRSVLVTKSGSCCPCLDLLGSDLNPLS